MKNQVITQEQGVQWLNAVYDKAIDGALGDNSNVRKMAQDYLIKFSSKEEACKAMMKNQVIKCTSSGVLSGLGGLITLPITLPLNITSVLYMQMRMVACTAYMAGYEPASDQTQTLVLACLMGLPITQLLKQAGIKFGTKMATKVIKNIPGKVITKINQAIGYRFITKFGTTGTINLGKGVPFLGPVIGGGVDYLETRAIAKRAYNFFFERQD